MISQLALALSSIAFDWLEAANQKKKLELTIVAI